MKSYIYKAMLASSSLFLLVSSPSMAQEAKKGGNSQVVTADADQGVSRQFTFTSGARIDKPLLTIAGGSERKTCSLWQRQNGKDVQVALPSKLTFSNACQLTGVADPVTEPQSAEYQVQVRDGTQGMIAKNVRITINPPLSVKCDPVVMTAGGEISVSQLPCQARGGTGATAIKYVGVDGRILTELPGGLKIDERGGISGKVPENTDSLKGVAIQFADAGGATVRAPITLDIRPPITMDVENVQITANGMTTPATIDPPLPVANISGGSGQISGGSLNGVLAADLGSVNLDGTTGNFIDKNVGTNKDVLVTNAALSGAKAHNYAVNYEQSSTTGTITPALLTVSNVSAQDKTYDGTTNATYTGTPVLTGVFASDAANVNLPIAHVVGSFADRNAGVGKDVVGNVQAAALTGAEAGNYRVNLIVADVSKATITPAMLTVSGAFDSKLFDGTTTSGATPTVVGLVGGDSVDNLHQQYNSMLPSKNKVMTVLEGFVVNDGNGGGNYVVRSIAGKGEIKGIPMGGGIAGLSSSGGSGSNDFVQSSKNLELINPVHALEDIRQKAEQADYFLKSNPVPAGTATHVGE